MTVSGAPDRPEGVRFWFRGEVRVVTDVPPTTTVLQWLRETERATGTKEGCNQGDCGACTVVVAAPAEGGVDVHTANACLLLLPLLNGRALFTIEDVGGEAGLHPVQEAMVEMAGSQCGFCTPGFVMSMWRSAERERGTGADVSRDSLADDLTGNLCRCTGYRPILDAAVVATGRVARSAEPGPLDDDVLEAALAAVGTSSGRLLGGPGGTFIAPASEDEMAWALRDRPEARIVSGGTDLLLSMRAVGDHLRDDVTLVSTDRVPAMGVIDESPDRLRIGAAVTLEAAWTVLVERLPALHRMWRRFASPAIRSVGTIGGNIANSSPIADLVPILHALDAELVCRDADGTRVVPIGEFATGPRRTILRPGEFLTRIDIPLGAFERGIKSHKVSRRFDDDISTVSATFSLRLDDGRIADLRAVFGGLAPTVRRATGVEQVLVGRRWTEDALSQAQAALDADFSPITDHRATDHYRRRAARGLMERWWRETGIDAPTGASDVWAGR